MHRWLRTSPDQAIHRFQQLSAPVAAKSVEDTAFYRYGRLLSRNDVGFNIECFADEAPAFHGKARRRHERLPHAMLATATHDHKHGEDVRARLAVLSERAEEWAALVRALDRAQRPLTVRWCALEGRYRHAAADDRRRLAARSRSPGQSGTRRHLRRVWRAGSRKALREAKLESDWAAVNEPYEAAAQSFLRALLADAEKPELLDEIAGFVEAIAAAGAVNGLAQLLLKLTVPGVPDIYQGTEYWDFSLVDPDNRRPVDYGTRAATLGTRRSGRSPRAGVTAASSKRSLRALWICAGGMKRSSAPVATSRFRPRGRWPIMS